MFPCVRSRSIRESSGVCRGVEGQGAGGGGAGERA
jgi:hypothetical protein